MWFSKWSIQKVLWCWTGVFFSYQNQNLFRSPLICFVCRWVSHYSMLFFFERILKICVFYNEVVLPSLFVYMMRGTYELILQLLLRLCNEVMYLYILLTWLKELIYELRNVIMFHILFIFACKVCLISNIQPLQSIKDYHYYY